MPKKTDKSIPVKDATYLHIYVGNNVKSLYHLIYGRWKEKLQKENLEKKSKESAITTQNYFLIDLLECMATRLNISFEELGVNIDVH